MSPSLREGLRAFPPPIALSLCTLGVACVGPNDRAPDTLRIAAAPVVVDSLLREVPFTIEDELQIGVVTDLLALADGFAVSHTGNEVLILDSRLRLVRRVGSAGSGPRELDDPVDLEAWGAGWAVLDRGNARVARYRPGSTIPELRPAVPAASQLAVAEDVVIVEAAGGSGRLSRLTDEGAVPFAAAEPAGRTTHRPTPAALASGYLGAGRDGRVHYFDVARRVLETYRLDGGRERALGLPADVGQRIDEITDGMVASFGRTAVASVTFVLGMSMAGSRPVLIAPSLLEVGVLGLIVEPSGRTAHRFVADPALRGGQHLQRVVGLAIAGTTLTIATEDGLFQFRLRFPGSWTG